MAVDHVSHKQEEIGMKKRFALIAVLLAACMVTTGCGEATKETVELAKGIVGVNEETAEELAKGMEEVINVWDIGFFTSDETLYQRVNQGYERPEYELVMETLQSTCSAAKNTEFVMGTLGEHIEVACAKNWTDQPVVLRTRPDQFINDYENLTEYVNSYVSDLRTSRAHKMKEMLDECIHDMRQDESPIEYKVYRKGDSAEIIDRMRKLRSENSYYNFDFDSLDGWAFAIVESDTKYGKVTEVKNVFVSWYDGVGPWRAEEGTEDITSMEEAVAYLSETEEQTEE